MKRGTCYMQYNFNDLKNIYIYGAGEYAHFLHSCLCVLGYGKNIKGFIVTKKECESYLGLPIIEYDVFLSDYYCDKLSIIIAMKESLAAQVEETLKKANINRYLIMDTCMQNYLINNMKTYYGKYQIVRNKVFFESFYGKIYGCNPKYITEELLNRREDLEIVWSMVDSPRDCIPKDIKQVERFSPDYFYEYYTSAVYICNSTCTLFNLKREGQYYLETWHGVGPFKKCGKDAVCDFTVGSSDGKAKEAIDALLAGSQFNVEFYRQAYDYKKEILKLGYPRNDIFFRDNSEIKKKVYEKYSISKNKKIVLYAPTFRNDRSVDSFKHYNLNIKSVVESLNDKFNNDFICVVKCHTILRQYLNSGEWHGEVIDASEYDDTQELLVAADVLISDYSSIIWDFALQRKPVFLYHADENEYKNDRGFYVPPEEWPYYIGHSNAEMLEKINQYDEASYRMALDEYFVKYGSYDDGHASKRVADRVLDVIRYPEKYGK